MRAAPKTICSHKMDGVASRPYSIIIFVSFMSYILLCPSILHYIVYYTISSISIYLEYTKSHVGWQSDWISMWGGWLLLGSSFKVV